MTRQVTVVTEGSRYIGASIAARVAQPGHGPVVGSEPDAGAVARGAEAVRATGRTA